MRSIKTMGSAVLVALALTAMVGVSAASAANWDPPGTNLAAHGTLTLTTNTGASVTCTYTSFVKATGDLAQTTNAAGNPAGPTWDSCTNSITTLFPTTVTSSSAWNATATSTTAVDVTNGNAVINIGGACTITAAGVSVANNVWNNSTHILTAASGTFPISESGFLCDGGTTGHMSGSIQLPASAIIT